MVKRTVTGSITFPDGSPCVGARVSAALYAAGETAYGTADDNQVGSAAVLTDPSGQWELDLDPNSSITPAGTLWRVTQVTPGGDAESFYVEVPDSDGPHSAMDILSEEPSTLPTKALAAHMALTSTAHGIGSYFAGRAAWVDVRDYGAETGSDVTAALAAAVEAAAAERVVWVPPGTWTISDTVVIDGCGMVMAPGARLLAAAGFTGTMVRVTARFGAGPIELDVTMPATQTASTGWYAGSDTTSVGVEFLSARFVNSYIRRVAGFHTGVRFAGDTSRGCSFNTTTIGLVENCKRSIALDSDATGWATHNTFIGGELVINGASEAGTGSRYIDIDGQSGNTFIGVTAENSVPEVNLEVSGGSSASANSFVGCRFEAGRLISFGASTTGNHVVGCYGVMGVNSAPGGSLEASVAGGACPVVDNGRNLIDGVYGKVGFTDSGNPNKFGSVAAYVARSTGYTAAGGYGDDVFFAGYTNGGTRVFAADVTGSVTLSGRLRTGQFTTAARPSASTAGAGAMVYDATLGKPIWSNGSVWKDAAGTTV